MFSLIIRSYDGPEALAATLRSVVSGVVEGRVGDALIVAPPGDLDSAQIADAAGAALIVQSTFYEGFLAAVTQMRQDTLLLIDGGIALPGFTLDAMAMRLPLGEMAVLASQPVQMGARGFVQRLIGRCTRDQALVMTRNRAALLEVDPWEIRFGRALTLVNGTGVRSRV